MSSFSHFAAAEASPAASQRPLCPGRTTGGTAPSVEAVIALPKLHHPVALLADQLAQVPHAAQPRDHHGGASRHDRRAEQRQPPDDVSEQHQDQPTKNAAGTAATSSTASNPMASTAFVDQPLFLAEYQTVMSPTLQAAQSQSRYVVCRASATHSYSRTSIGCALCRPQGLAAGDEGPRGGDRLGGG